LALVATTLLWGVSFVVVQRAIVSVPILHLLSARFWIALVVLAPLFLRQRDLVRRATRPLALAVSACLFTGFLLQTHGLRFTTPARSAFLTGMAVVFVPGVAWLLRAGRPTRLQIAATALAALGLAVIYGAGSIGGEPAPFNRGDALTLLGAFVFAFHIVFIERALPSTGVLPLVFSQFAFIALAALPSFFLVPISAAELSPASLLSVLVIGVVCSAAAFFLQLFGQQRLSAVEAALLLTLEPVFATAFSIAAGAESWHTALGVGGALIILGTVVANWPGGPSGPARSDRPADRTGTVQRRPLHD
jgi:drug/metabolite transporter (DMT)-like permease